MQLDDQLPGKLVDIEQTPEEADADADEGQASEDHQDGRTGDGFTNSANPTDRGREKGTDIGDDLGESRSFEDGHSHTPFFRNQQGF